jgi:biopolymer transport protein ExbB
MENTPLPPTTTANTPSDMSLVHFWMQGDGIIHFVALLLVVLSLVSWGMIIYKGWQMARLAYLSVALERFWRSPDMDWAEGELKKQEEAYDMLQEGLVVARHEGRNSLTLQGNRIDAITRAIRHSMAYGVRSMERGLTLLASIGAVAPFIGLFGTVWGIYHALLAIGNSGQASIANISGPVGESLIMTAAGLFVAIPAVFAYNSFARSARSAGAELDGFAYDLQAFLAGKSPTELQVYLINKAA